MQSRPGPSRGLRDVFARLTVGQARRRTGGVHQRGQEVQWTESDPIAFPVRLWDKFGRSRSSQQLRITVLKVCVFLFVTVHLSMHLCVTFKTILQGCGAR